eukprot:6096906-Prymnesium_polylepis.1
MPGIPHALPASESMEVEPSDEAAQQPTPPSDVDRVIRDLGGTPVPAKMIQELFAKPGAQERHTTLLQEVEESAQRYEELQVSRRLMSEHTVHEREDAAFSHGQVLLKRRKEDQRDRVTSVDVKDLFDET